MVSIGSWALAACVAGSTALATSTQASSQSTKALLVCNFRGESPGTNTPWTSAKRLSRAIEFDGWSLGDGAIAAPEVDDALGFYVVADKDLSTVAEAVIEDEYISCSFSTKDSRSLDLSGARIRLGVRRASWHAARRYAVFTSETGFAPGNELFVSSQLSNANEQEATWSFFLPSSGFKSIEELEIRIYAIDARHSGHETGLSSFAIHTGIETRRVDLSSTPGGTATTNPAGTVFELGDTIRLEATPDPGYRFAGWTGMVEGLGNPRSLKVKRDTTITAKFEPVSVERMTIGTNLSEVVDWATAWSYVDLQQRTRAWRTREVGSTGGPSTGFDSEVPTNHEGWPTEVPFTASDGSRQIVHTALRSANEPGTYKFLYRGTGVLILKYTGGSTTYLPTGGEREHTFELPERGSLWYEIHETSPDDPLRDIHIVHEDHAQTYESEPYHPLYLARLAPFGVLRFMDWGRTNGSPVVEWRERTRRDHYTQARLEGASLRSMIDLANRTGKDAWVCIPHEANNDFVRRAARLVRDELDPRLRVWVEYSNETWNSSGAFTQTDYTQAMGVELGLDEDPWRAGQRFVALRSSQIWRIFEQELGREELERLVKVLATQSARPALTEMRLEALSDPGLNPRHSFPDVLAIAPYFGHSFEPEGLPPHYDRYPTVSEIVDPLSRHSIEALRPEIAAHRALADQHGLQLVAYEGGQHFVGKRGAENDDALTDILQSANRDPRMYERYTEYLAMLDEEGIELFCNYTFCREWNKWGSWGSLEIMDQPLTLAPKFRALMDWIETL